MLNQKKLGVVIAGLGFVGAVLVPVDRGLARAESKTEGKGGQKSCGGAKGCGADRDGKAQKKPGDDGKAQPAPAKEKGKADKGGKKDCGGDKGCGAGR